MSIVLFNYRSNFVFKIKLFRCKVNETSITLIIFIFLFYQENLQKRKIYIQNAYVVTRFNPLPLYAPVRFRHDPLPVPLPEYVLLWMALYFVRSKFFITHVSFLEST